MTKYSKHKCINKLNEINNHPDLLMIFGRGNDLQICNLSNINNKSYSKLGVSYEPPNGLTYDSLDCNNYLAG